MDMLHNQLHGLTLVLHYATKNALKGSMLRKAWSNRPILNHLGGALLARLFASQLQIPFLTALPASRLGSTSAFHTFHGNGSNVWDCDNLRLFDLLSELLALAQGAQVVVKAFYSVLPLDTQRIPGTYNMSKVSKGIIWYWYCPKRDPKRDPISLNDTAVAMSNILKSLNVDLWQQLLENHWWITIINIM